MGTWLQERRAQLAHEGATAAVAERDVLAMGGAGFYEGASFSRRFLDMSAPRSGPNTPILTSGGTLTDRTYALARNESYARRALNVLTVATVGEGLTPLYEIEGDPTLERAVAERWEESMEELDADGMTDGYGLQAQVVRGVFTGGDSFPRVRERFATDRARHMPVPLAVPLQVQMHGAEMVPREKNEDLGDGRRIIGGIEINAIGDILAYHMHRYHPSEWVMSGSGRVETVRVPARDVMHVHEVLREGQMRGEPRAASVILPAHDLHQGEDALQRAWNLQAFVSGFFELASPVPGTPGVSLTGAGVPGAAPGAKPNAAGVMPATFEAGDIIALKPGQSFKRAEAPDVGATYDVATQWRLRRMCAGLGVPYEFVAMDLHGVTYSAARVGLIQFWAECDQFLWLTLVPQYLRPLFIRWFDLAVRAGRLPLSLSKYLENPRHYLKCSWIPPKRPWVDPLKDVQAELLAIEGGLSSRDESILGRGRIPADVDRSRRRSILRAKDLEVTDGKGPTAVVEDQPEEPAQQRKEAA